MGKFLAVIRNCVEKSWKPGKKDATKWSHQLAGQATIWKAQLSAFEMNKKFTKKKN
jgi:hypothetical protein